MALPFLAGAEGAYPIHVALATGDNAIDFTDYGLDDFNSGDDYTLWCEAMGTYLALKVTAGALTKDGEGFTAVATADLNGVYVTFWVIPHGGVNRIVI